ncbi:cytochrome c3 family protein [Anaeromyxobacter paludicola]|uniref:Cytochrome c n=1 Tax=Anaeromyxobacter paludicola TaxID=2918171 RepID=A0ABM7X6F9_9BACT|nr:cytochrome c3 family protein [Anaeromyxobacter paludicola]BDG07406.1 cytochrome c [Anaeromyxobacter paludicola]
MPRDHAPRLLALLPALAVWAALAAPAPARAGIRNTSHDLSYSSANSSGIKALNAADNDVCKFCHTPHNASTTRGLWNHKDTTVSSYNSNGSGGQLTTSAGTPLPSSMRAETKRCLACHDGTVELGAVMNSGGVSTSIPMTGVTANKLSLATDSTYVVGNSGDMSAQHPVGIPYAAQTSSYNGITSKAGPADGTTGNYYAPLTTGCLSPSTYCTAAPNNGVQSGKLINLIRDSSTGGLGVECTTCHDPHNNANGTFLRVLEGTGDGLCRSCHNK